MDNTVMQCIKVRTDFFEKYYSVPNEIRPEINSFVQRLYALGEASLNAQDFEAKFVANGYQAHFNSLLGRCIPKQYQMTSDEKAFAKQTAKEMFKDDSSRIVKEAAKEAFDHASVMAEEEMIAQNRKAMINAGVYDDYTRANNAIDIAKDVGGIFKNLFKKKK